MGHHGAPVKTLAPGINTSIHISATGPVDLWPGVEWEDAEFSISCVNCIEYITFNAQFKTDFGLIKSPLQLQIQLQNLDTPVHFMRVFSWSRSGHEMCYF